MTKDVGFPLVQTHLPELMDFVSGLAQAFRSGELPSWDALAEQTQAFFTPERLGQVEAVVPGWRAMASYADGKTLVHVMCAFIGLLRSPEYQRATPTQQEEMHWIILLHDLAKWVRSGERDSSHPFRSAAMTGTILPAVGFPVTDEYERGFEGWSALVHAAVIVQQTGSKTSYVHDNRYLRPIVDDIERLYGPDTPIALIAQAILLHTSISVLQAWPQAAPLTEAEEKRYLTREVFPLLKMMMLADNDGWELFTENRAPFRQETLVVFNRIEAALE